MTWETAQRSLRTGAMYVADPFAAEVVLAELDRLRKFERMTADVEWGVGDPDDCDDPDSVREVPGPSGLTMTDRDYGRSLLRREVRRGTWTRA